ncbi:enoyl-CoA hydratase [Roseomonas sp. NAR14]|uniref:Enoyl-CoA hydratase domain-containing protein 3, mitochondrial n=1 Tax=Roseomonas acroporae TaxID=2937791 RepID=A0A9X1Y6H7_9PROT|nr:enoyl-CoA hydratase [Roseomonas acroporae]MCK8784030.1 enoyl-CoA hydratase [Roseomonas acroporae]
MTVAETATAPSLAPSLAPSPASPLLREEADGIVTLTLNRPETRNSLSRAMLEALDGTLARLAADRSVRAVVLAARGTVFSAGHDLREITAARDAPDAGRAVFADLMERCAAVMLRVQSLPQPVIAAVEGVATAAGCQLVATCDLAVAGEGARFCTPGVDIGLFCSTPAVALSRAVPRKAAMEMLLLGEMIPAGEAHRIGLVNRVVPAGGALAAAQDLARRIAARSALTIRLGKQGFYAQSGMEVAEAYAHAAGVMVENLLARDAAEGIGAFLGKRRPVWEDR